MDKITKRRARFVKALESGLWNQCRGFLCVEGTKEEEGDLFCWAGVGVDITDKVKWNRQSWITYTSRGARYRYDYKPTEEAFPPVYVIDLCNFYQMTREQVHKFVRANDGGTKFKTLAQRMRKLWGLTDADIDAVEVPE